MAEDATGPTPDDFRGLAAAARAWEAATRPEAGVPGRSYMPKYAFDMLRIFAARAGVWARPGPLRPDAMLAREAAGAVYRAAVEIGADREPGEAVWSVGSAGTAPEMTPEQRARLLANCDLLDAAVGLLDTIAALTPEQQEQVREAARKGRPEDDPDRNARIIALFREGKPIPAIAERLGGGETRHSVRGVLNRAGLVGGRPKARRKRGRRNAPE